MIRVESQRDRVNVAKVYEAHQEQIFEYWEELDADQRKSLLDQVDGLDFGELSRLVRTYLDRDESSQGTLGELEPAPLVRRGKDAAGDLQAEAAGWDSLQSGEVALLIVAGGQGTRLKFEGPKGLFPIGPVTERTLFQYHAEKIVSLGRKAKKSIPWIVMTSESNHADTVAYFHANHFFGLNPADVHFEPQAMLPIVDPRRGKILLKDKHELALSPNGHGGAVEILIRKYDFLAKRGIKYVFTFQVDNPLAIIGDPLFVGYHKLLNSEFSSKATPKIAPEEKVGVFCKVGKGLRVVEYTELSEEYRNRQLQDGSLAFGAGNIAQHVISLDFLNPDREGAFDMPYHVARKAISFIRDGEPVDPLEPNSVRFESFVFDLLPFAKNPIVLEVERAREFAPVKNAAGVDSADSSRRLLSEEWAHWLEEAGVKVPRNSRGELEHPIEISPLFANRPEELKNKLQGVELSLDEALVLQ